MIDLATVAALLKHSDWANEQITSAAAALKDPQLDRPFEMGPGTLRRTLLHTLAGESVWLQRWMGHRDTPWPDERENAGPGIVLDRFRSVWRDRDAFLTSLGNHDTSRVITYRDSKGSLYQATLGDMMLQTILHSAHHRAQMVNMLRHLGAAAPELDHMYHVRRPA